MVSGAALPASVFSSSLSNVIDRQPPRSNRIAIAIPINITYVAAAIHGPIDPVLGKYVTAIHPPPTINTQLKTAVTTPGYTVSPAPLSAPVYTIPNASTV